MNKYVIKTITGETLYIYAAYFRVEKEFVNFYDNSMRFVSACVLRNIICIYVENADGEEVKEDEQN